MIRRTIHDSFDAFSNIQLSTVIFHTSISRMQGTRHGYEVEFP